MGFQEDIALLRYAHFGEDQHSNPPPANLGVNGTGSAVGTHPRPTFVGKAKTTRKLMDKGFYVPDAQTQLLSSKTKGKYGTISNMLIVTIYFPISYLMSRP